MAHVLTCFRSSLNVRPMASAFGQCRMCAFWDLAEVETFLSGDSCEIPWRICYMWMLWPRADLSCTTLEESVHAFLGVSPFTTPRRPVMSST